MNISSLLDSCNNVIGLFVHLTSNSTRNTLAKSHFSAKYPALFKRAFRSIDKGTCHGNEQEHHQQNLVAMVVEVIVKVIATVRHGVVVGVGELPDLLLLLLRRRLQPLRISSVIVLKAWCGNGLGRTIVLDDTNRS